MLDSKIITEKKLNCIIDYALDRSVEIPKELNIPVPRDGKSDLGLHARYELIRWAFTANKIPRGTYPKKIIDGVYEMPVYSMEEALRMVHPNLEESPCIFALENNISYREECPQGLCDDYSQILRRYPKLLESKRTFFVEMYLINPRLRMDLTWGECGYYIGEKSEYLVDDRNTEIFRNSNVDTVYRYQVYELLF